MPMASRLAPWHRPIRRIGHVARAGMGHQHGRGHQAQRQRGGAQQPEERTQSGDTAWKRLHGHLASVGELQRHGALARTVDSRCCMAIWCWRGPSSTVQRGERCSRSASTSTAAVAAADAYQAFPPAPEAPAAGRTSSTTRAVGTPGASSGAAAPARATAGTGPGSPAARRPRARAVRGPECWGAPTPPRQALVPGAGPTRSSRGRRVNGIARRHGRSRPRRQARSRLTPAPACWPARQPRRGSTR